MSYTYAELKAFKRKVTAKVQKEGFNYVEIDTSGNRIIANIPSDLPQPYIMPAEEGVPSAVVKVVIGKSKAEQKLENLEITKDTPIAPTATAVDVKPATAGHSNGLRSTMSWGVKYNGKYCYLFTGHGTSSGSSVFYNGVNIGKTIFLSD